MLRSAGLPLGPAKVLDALSAVEAVGLDNRDDFRAALAAVLVSKHEHLSVFEQAFDLFWLIEPNFKDAARNLHFSWGILEYIAVPVAMVSIWVAYYSQNLKTRPLVQTNDPHVAEILEPEHVHA